jgi:hypothetical protein
MSQLAGRIIGAAAALIALECFVVVRLDSRENLEGRLPESHRGAPEH